MNLKRNEDISAIYVIALETDASVAERKKLHRFLNWDRPGDCMALYHHEVLISTYDENQEKIMRKLELPVVATTILDNGSYLLYDEENAMLFREEDLMFVSEYPGGPLEFDSPDEVIAVLEEMRQADFEKNS